MYNHPLERYKKIIRDRLKKLLAQKRESLSDTRWGVDIMNRLESLVLRGKMFRGSALLGLYELLSSSGSPESVVDIACALEIIQTGLIIHDDILDRSELRRGLPAMQVQYRTVLPQSDNGEGHTAEMFALCVGDICFHWADELIANANISDAERTRISGLVSRELILVQLAQMTDMTYSGAEEPREQDILALYKDKTARYTFVMPFTIAGFLSGSSPAVLHQLTTIGTHTGLIFQLVDDDIGIFGSPKTTGKSVLTDIAENKKTLLRYFLFTTVTPDQLTRIQRIFGNKNVTEKDLVYIRNILIKTGARKRVLDYVASLRKETLKNIAHSSLSPDVKKLMEAILELVTERNK